MTKFVLTTMSKGSFHDDPEVVGPFDSEEEAETHIAPLVAAGKIVTVKQLTAPKPVASASNDDEAITSRDVDIRAEADTLDRIDVIYDVTLNICVNAGTYSGPLDNAGIAALVESRGIEADDIVSANIIEVTLDEKVIARAGGRDDA